MTPPHLAAERRIGPAIAAVQTARADRLRALADALTAVLDDDQPMAHEHRGALLDAADVVEWLRGPAPDVPVLNAGGGGA